MTMTMNDETQPRHNNGQYGSKTGSPANVELTAHPEATFEYPPERYESLDDYVTFWENVDVPTPTLDSMRTAYKVARQDYVTRRSDEAYQALMDGDPNWETRKFGDPNRWMSDVQQARNSGAQQGMAEWDSSYAPAIQRHEARTVARSLQMFYYAEFLNGHDKAAVLNHPVTLNGQVTSVQNIREYYGFCDGRSGFDSTAFEPNESRVIAEIENLRTYFEQQRERDEAALYIEQREAAVAALGR